MKKSKRAIGSDLRKVDAHKITAKEYREAPPFTDEQLRNAVIEEGGKPVKRGRPFAAFPKQVVKLRVDQDVVARFRAGGDGWQTRMNVALRKAVGLKPRAAEKRA